MEIAPLLALLLVTAAAGCDLYNHRIPNALTYPAWVAGLALGLAAAGLAGLANAAIGFAVCFIPMLILFVGGSIGGGDVKLMGGVGALLGFPEGLNALISAILVGGFLAAIVLLWQGRLLPLVRYGVMKAWRAAVRRPAPEPPAPHKDNFPFGVAIALGTYLTVASIVAGYHSPANLLPDQIPGM